MPRRVGTGVDPKRLSMIVAVLGRHAGVALGQADVFVNVAGGVRIDEPGADLGVALAIASAARGAPVGRASPCFGEIGLTGRLRPASQAERRLAECAKLGLRRGVVPEGTAVPWQNAPDSGGDAAPGDRGVGSMRADPRKDKTLLSALSQVAPGTPLRSGIDDIIRAELGALIVIGEPNELAFLFSGGMRLDLPFTSQLLYELAKMDGAIIVNAATAEARLRERPADARPDDRVGRDRHAAPHRRARREADRRARRSRSRSSARR